MPFHPEDPEDVLDVQVIPSVDVAACVEPPTSAAQTDPFQATADQDPLVGSVRLVKKARQLPRSDAPALAATSVNIRLQ